MVERRSASVVELRETEDGVRQADLRIVSYNTIDSYKTTFAPGVFTRSIDSAGGSVAAVWGHDPHRPIGTVGGFHEVDNGLNGTLTFLDFDAVPDARMAHAAMKAGAIKGVSFGFERGSDEENVETPGVRDITEAKIVEVSPVLNPAVPGSRVLATRSTGAVSVATASDLVTRFAAGQLDLAEALTALKEERARMEDTVSNDPEDEAAEEKEESSVLKQAVSLLEGLASDSKLSPAETSTLTQAILLLKNQDNEEADDAARSSDTDTEVRDTEQPVEASIEDLEVEDRLTWLSRRAVASSSRSATVKAGAKKPYGNVAYADPKNGKYPVDTEDHAKAAWAYINMPKNAEVYPVNGVSLDSVKSRIKAALKKFGVEVQEDAPKGK